MDRYNRRLNATMAELKQAGYEPKFVPAEDESVDDEIDLGNGLSVQICSMSGDAVAACQVKGEYPNAEYWSVTIDDDDDLLEKVKQAKAKA